MSTHHHFTEPRLDERSERQYLGLPVTTTMAELPATTAAGFQQLYAWLGEHGIEPDEPPFVRYRVIDMMHALELDIAVPASDVSAADDTVRAGTLPAGRYVVLDVDGPYSELVAANAHLQQWANDRGIVLAHDDTAWPGRVETYLAPPRDGGGPVELAYLT